MKFQTKNIFPFAAGAVLIAGGVIFLHYYSNQHLLNQDKTYKQLVKAQDLLPLPTPPKGRELKLPILMYHHVGNVPEKADAMRQDLTVPTADFEQEVRWAAKAGYQSVKLQDIYLYSKGQNTLPKKSIIFSFDDGYQDVFDNAVPILKKYGFSASFGIITQFPGQQQGNNIYAPWDQIAKAYQDGSEVVSHTQDHFDGKDPKFGFDYILQNLSGSVLDIYNHLGFTTNVLIYPYGHYTVGYVEQAKKAGFVLGVTVHEGNLINLDDLMEIPRIRVHGRESLEKFKQLISE